MSEGEVEMVSEDMIEEHEELRVEYEHDVSWKLGEFWVLTFKFAERLR